MGSVRSVSRTKTRENTGKKQKEMKAEVQRRVKETQVSGANGGWRAGERNEGVKRRQSLGKGQVHVEWKRRPQQRTPGLGTRRQELVIRLEASPSVAGAGTRRGSERQRTLTEGRQGRKTSVQAKLRQKAEGSEGRTHGKGTQDQEWKEQVARVGTGYRVRRDEKDPRKRRFDVGYSDRKEYKRKEGVEVQVEASNTGRRVRAKGADARVKVMNAVCGMEKRRPASPYTGSGIRRKSRVGKRKLKPTKPQGKA